MSIVLYLLERKMQMPLLMAVNISFLLVHRMHSKLIAIYLMAMQLSFQATVLILAVLDFIVDDLICTKELTLARYLMV